LKLSPIPNLEGYGVFVDDIDFNHLTRDQWMSLGKLQMEQLVMIIRRTGININRFHQVMKMWGKCRQNYAAKEETDTEVAKEYARIGGHAATGHIVRVAEENGLFGSGDLLWHSNESGDIAFTPGVALLGDHGMTKSATGFMVTSPYYYSLSESMRSELDEMVLVHNFQEGKINVNDENNVVYKNMCPEPETEIPLVIQSPAGIKGLHFPYNTTTRIKDYPIEESVRLLEEIKFKLTQYYYDYWWENDDDLLIFDNSIVQHRRLGDTTDRLCYRYQFDYSYLQYKVTGKPYMPYFQEPYISRYKKKMGEISKVFPVFGYPPP
tara:strand:+ start:84 stop:1049 length:966 start_codon:yes stop_codon:yes gene_type:complete